MDQKTWLWRKRPSEKTIMASNKDDLARGGTEEEGPLPPTNKEVALQKSIDALNEKLANILDDCATKEKLMEDLARREQEATAGKDKAEEKVQRLENELDEALREKVAANERLGHLNAALKDCMQQLNLSREEKEQRVHDAVMKTSEEFEKAYKKLEEKLVETSKRVASLGTENSFLSKALSMKEKLVEDLGRCKSQTEAEFDTLMARLDSSEKENAFLRYEFRMLEKELDIQNEEMKYERRAAEASHKQYLENTKRIKKLEAECQRLRAIARKRMPGPGSLVNVKTEIERQGRDMPEARRRKTTSTKDLVIRDSNISFPDISGKKLSSLVDHLRELEEENKILKEILRSSQLDVQRVKLSKFQGNMLQNPVSKELSVVSGYDITSENETTGSQSWASESILELDDTKHRNPRVASRCKMIGASEMSLMDDFVEMEKLAIVSLDAPLTISDASTDHLDSTTKELVPVGKNEFCEVDRELQRRDPLFRNPNDWLHAVVKTIMEQSCVSGRSLEALVEDIRLALHHMNVPCNHRASGEDRSAKPEPCNLLPVSGYITWKSPTTSPRVKLVKDIQGCFKEDGSKEFIPSNLHTSICEIMDLVSRFTSQCSEDRNTQHDLLKSDISTFPCEMSPANTDYLMYVFRWRSCEISNNLAQFLQTCSHLLVGEIKFEKFAADIASTLRWVINNCFVHQDNLTVREIFKKHVGGTGQGSLLELESVQSLLFEIETIHCILQVEHEALKTELNYMKTSKKDLETILQSATDIKEALMQQLQQSQQTIGNLQTEVETLKESKRIIEDQFENQKLINEDLDTQLTVNKAKLNNILQKLSSVEVELEDKGHSYEELEATCLELQLQLESIASKHLQENNQERQLLQTGLEITNASAKLAECQETLLKLVEQQKALTLAKRVEVVDKTLSFSDTGSQKFKKRSSLLDQMLSEDNTDIQGQISPEMKEVKTSTDTQEPSNLQLVTCNSLSTPSLHIATSEALFHLKHEAKLSKAGPLVVYAAKKRGAFGLLRKLLLRKKKANCKKSTYAFSP